MVPDGMKRQTAATNRLSNAMGSMNFQAKFISWSMRRRGSVLRIQISMAISTRSLAKNQKYEGTQARKENGAVQPPRKRVMARPQMANIPMYSPRKNRANLKPEYSTK